METLNRKEIEKDEDVYPRQRINHKTIENYLEALKAGAKFPPIEVQRIFEGEEEKVVVLDGLHRIEAYKLCDRSEIDVEYWKDEVLDKAEHLEDLRIRSLQANLNHGLRVAEGDIGYQASRIVKDRPLEKLKGIVKELADKFGVTESTMSELVGELVRRKRASRDSVIYGMSLLGWTQREIADVMGMDFTAISKNLKKFGTELFQLFCQEYESGMSPENIASQHGLTLPVLWSILLKGKSDLERFELLKRDDLPKLYDIWNFSERDKRFGIEYPGNIPAGIVLNTLYYYTKQGDLVVDPMAGGGVVVDCCLAMGRRCRSFDIELVRKEIEFNDITKGYPKKAKNCDLVFLDPPYYKKKEADYGSESVSSLDRNSYLNAFDTIANNSLKTIKQGGFLAFLMEPYIDYQQSEKSIWVYEYIFIFTKRGWKVERVFDVPESSQRYQAHDVERAKKNKQILTLRRQLLIFRR